MRRTSLMVLVLAVLFAATACTTPALIAQPLATHRVRKPAHHSAKTSKTPKTSKTSERRASRSSAPRRTTAPCIAHANTGRASSRAAGHTRRHNSNSPIAQSVPRGIQPVTEPEATAPKTHARVVTPALVLPPSPARTVSAPEPQPVSFHWNRRVIPPPMRGSLESLERQNDRATADGLERIEDESDLSDRIARGALVPVPVSAALSINPELSEHHRYCRPWTARFLSDLARSHEAQFHAPLNVSSAVRTVEYQRRLIAINGNAAPADGDIASPHLTGATVDIAKSSLSRQEIGWMRSFLLPLQAAGKIDVEEEFQQACFHISVYKSYVPARSPRTPQPKGNRPSNAEVAGGQSALGR